MTSPQGMRLRSAIRGRQRWEVEALRRKPDLAQEMEEILLRHAGILQVHANAVSGRILVVYLPETPDLDIQSLLRACLRELSSREIPRHRTTKSSVPLFRILKTSLPERKQLAKPPLLSVAGHTLQLLQSMSFVATLNTARGQAPGYLRSLGLVRTGPQLLFLSGLSLLLTGAGLWVQHKSKMAWGRLAHAIRHRLRARLFARIQAQDLAFFDSYGTGQIIKLATEDTARIGEFIERTGNGAIGKALTIVVSATALSTSSLSLVFLSCLPLPLMLLTARSFRRMAAERYAHLGAVSGNYTQMLENNLAGIAIVKSFTAERDETRRLTDCDSDLSNSSMDAASVAFLESSAIRSVFSLGFILTAGYGGQMVAQGKISSADYISAVYWSPQLLESLTGIEEIIRLYRSATHSAEQLLEVLDSRPRIRSGPARLPVKTVRGDVVFEDVSFGYNPSMTVIENISFHLRPGETLAIVGPTGSGKSTLIRLLLRFFDVQSGRILVDGSDVREMNLRDLRAAIGLVSQDTYLFQGTVRENVLYGQRHADELQVVDAMRDAGALNLLQSLSGGLDAEVGERGQRLSGGERQRVAIARAILKGAPILALDEATSHLDYETESAVKRSVRKAASGRSMIIIAHRLATIRDADRIIVLDRGKIREEGNHDDLLAQRGLYASLWQLQTGKASFDGEYEL